MKNKFNTCIAIMLLIIFLPIVTYADDILFRDVPWYSNIDEVLSSLGLIEVADENSPIIKPGTKKIYSTIVPEALLGFPSYSGIRYENTGYITSDAFKVDLKVAGYSLRRLYLQFMYCIENDKVIKDKYKARFVSGKYYIIPFDSYEKDYEVLLDKLVHVYGEPFTRNQVLINNDIEVGKSSYWKGNNNASIILYYYYYNDGINRELAIEYAVSDLNDQLEAIVTMQKYSSEDLEGL